MKIAADTPIITMKKKSMRATWEKVESFYLMFFSAFENIWSNSWPSVRILSVRRRREGAD
jgi:hypothetical protein